MLDIQFIRENRELVAEKSKQKLADVDIDQLLGFDDKRRELLAAIEPLRQERNVLADKAKGGQPQPADIERGRELKNQIADLEHQLSSVELEFYDLLKKVPNMPTDDTPVGASEDDNVVVSTVGEKPSFDFEPRTHDQIFLARGWLDKERAARISGARFAYFLGPLVELQFALITWVISVLGSEETLKAIAEDAGLAVDPKPFVPVLPPMMMKTEAYEATGRLKAEDVTYKLADDDLWLIGSAEHSLCSMYLGETLDRESLPLRYIGYSTSFRREAGTYGKDTAGIIRMHHFDKLEMESLTSGESSRDEHLFFVAIQEYLMKQLGLHYQVLLKCTADIGDPNARGVDINAWFPGQNAYRETHTADYMTDYQARGLKTRYQNGESSDFVHTNDGTALALGRAMAAIAEQYQTKEMRIRVPEVLKPYLNGREEL